MKISTQNFRSMLERSCHHVKHMTATEKAIYHACTLEFQLGCLFIGGDSIEISDENYQQLMILAS